MLPDEDAKSFLKQQRGLLVVDASFDHVRNSQAFMQAVQTVVNRFSAAQTDAFLIGLDAEQLNYNALLSKRIDIDQLFRTAIARDSALDGTFPKLAALRQSLGSVNSGDWKTIAKQSAAMVTYILSVH